MLPTLFNGFKYGEVEAKCLSNQKRNIWYYTTYEYNVDGEKYINESDEGWEFPETVGKTVTIYYLKDDPNFITELNPGLDTAGTIIIIISLILVGSGIGLIVLYNKKKHNGNTSEDLGDFESDGDVEEQPKTEATKKVHYGRGN